MNKYAFISAQLQDFFEEVKEIKIEKEIILDDFIYDEPEVSFENEQSLHSYEKEIHRKHRASVRKAKEKAKHRQHTRWLMYVDGTAKECKINNHKAVRREYDIPMGKGNFTHKINSFLYIW